MLFRDLYFHAGIRKITDLQYIFIYSSEGHEIGRRPVSSRRLGALPVGFVKLASSGRCRFFVDYVAKRPYLKYPERQQV